MEEHALNCSVHNVDRVEGGRMFGCIGAGVGDSVPPHLMGCEGVEHLVFEEEPQPLPFPLALLPALQAAAHGGALHTKRHLRKGKTGSGSKR